MSKQSSPKNFESAFDRLDTILEKLSSDTVSLDDSLKHYEEANTLLIYCNDKLNQAEQKINTLVKDRDSKLVLDEQGRPTTTDFSPKTTEETDPSQG